MSDATPLSNPSVILLPRELRLTGWLVVDLCESWWPAQTTIAVTSWALSANEREPYNFRYEISGRVEQLCLECLPIQIQLRGSVCHFFSPFSSLVLVTANKTKSPANSVLLGVENRLIWLSAHRRLIFQTHTIEFGEALPALAAASLQPSHHHYFKEVLLLQLPGSREGAISRWWAEVGTLTTTPQEKEPHVACSLRPSRQINSSFMRRRSARKRKGAANEREKLAEAGNFEVRTQKYTTAEADSVDRQTGRNGSAAETRFCSRCGSGESHLEHDAHILSGQLWPGLQWIEWPIRHAFSLLPPPLRHRSLPSRAFPTLHIPYSYAVADRGAKQGTEGGLKKCILGRISEKRENSRQIKFRPMTVASASRARGCSFPHSLCFHVTKIGFSQIKWENEQNFGARVSQRRRKTSQAVSLTSNNLISCFMSHLSSAYCSCSWGKLGSCFRRPKTIRRGPIVWPRADLLFYGQSGFVWAWMLKAEWHGGKSVGKTRRHVAHSNAKRTEFVYNSHVHRHAISSSPSCFAVVFGDYDFLHTHIRSSAVERRPVARFLIFICPSVFFAIIGVWFESDMRNFFVTKTKKMISRNPMIAHKWKWAWNPIIQTSSFR